MEDSVEANESKTWSRRKKDAAPRGVFRHPSGVWAIRFTCGAGHLHKEKIGARKIDATEAHNARRARARHEAGWCPIVKRRTAVDEATRQAQARRHEAARAITLQAYAEEWLASHVAQDCRERTAQQYSSVLVRHVYPALGDIALGALTRGDLKRFFAARAATGLSRRTLKNIWVPLSAMLNAAVDEERIVANPATRLWRRRRARTEEEARKCDTLTPSELALVLGTAEKFHADHADVLYTLAWTGLRLSEACALQWADLDLAGQFLTVNRTATYRDRRVILGAPKSGKARRVDLPSALVARLQTRRSIREAEAVVAGREPGVWVFPSPSDPTKPMDGAFVRYKVWYRVLRRARLRQVRVHDLRHTYASLLLEAGEPMLYVKDQLGHSTIQTTVDLYGHVKPGKNREAVDRLAALTRPSDAEANAEVARK
jgi:integrase